MIVELRRYTLKPGQRDTLVELFEEHFIDSQEAVGIKLLGQFYDLDDADQFVWLRAFPDMAARKAALTAFYYESDAWRTHGPAANATMVDSSNVLLLRPVGPMFAGTSGAGHYTVTISTEPIDVADVPDAVARFETEPAENDFPRLPVRTGPHHVAFQAGLRVDLQVDHGKGLRLRPTPRSALA